MMKYNLHKGITHIATQVRRQYLFLQIISSIFFNTFWMWLQIRRKWNVDRI